MGLGGGIDKDITAEWEQLDINHQDRQHETEALPTHPVGCRSFPDNMTSCEMPSDQLWQTMPICIEPTLTKNPPRAVPYKSTSAVTSIHRSGKEPRHEFSQPLARNVLGHWPAIQAQVFRTQESTPPSLEPGKCSTCHSCIALVFLASLTLTGCYSEYYLTNPGTTPAIISPSTRSSHGGFPVYLATTRQELADENEPNPTYALSRALLQTGLYPAVHLVPPQGNFIEATLAVRVAENEDEQSGNIAKMVFTGASFFLLSAALPQTNHLDADYILDVNWPNAAHRRYSAHCGAYSYATIDKYRDVKNSAKELRQTACLNSLVNQMTADYPRMTQGIAYTPPKGMTTGQLTQWGRTRDPNQAKPDAVCTEVGLTPGTKSYSDCLSELK